MSVSLGAGSPRHQHADRDGQHRSHPGLARAAQPGRSSTSRTHRDPPRTFAAALPTHAPRVWGPKVTAAPLAGARRLMRWDRRICCARPLASRSEMAEENQQRNEQRARYDRGGSAALPGGQSDAPLAERSAVLAPASAGTTQESCWPGSTDAADIGSAGCSAGMRSIRHPQPSLATLAPCAVPSPWQQQQCGRGNADRHKPATPPGRPSSASTSGMATRARFMSERRNRWDRNNRVQVLCTHLLANANASPGSVGPGKRVSRHVSFQ
jgi:hypothetical protein